MVKRVLTSIITLAVLMGSVVACSGSDSELAELRQELEQINNELEQTKSELNELKVKPTPKATSGPTPDKATSGPTPEKLGYEEKSARDWIASYLASSIGGRIANYSGERDKFIEECLLKEIEGIAEGTPQTDTNFWRTQKQKFVNGDYNKDRDGMNQAFMFKWGINLTFQEKIRVRNCASDVFSGSTFTTISNLIDVM